MTVGQPYNICDTDEGDGCSNGNLDLSMDVS